MNYQACWCTLYTVKKILQNTMKQLEFGSTILDNFSHSDHHALDAKITGIIGVRTQGY